MKVLLTATVQSHIKEQKFIIQLMAFIFIKVLQRKIG